MKYSKLSLSQIDSRIDSLVSSAKRYKQTSEELHAGFKVLQDELKSTTPSGRKRYSGFVSAYALGYYMALVNDITHNELEFGYVRDDKIYSTMKYSIHYSTETLLSEKLTSAQWDDLERHHYWKNTSQIWF